MKIEVKNLNKSFKNDVIIQDLSYCFQEGKIYGIFGYNGSGKSVFLKVLAGLYKPTSGEILVDGENYFKNNTFLNDLGAIIEKPAFIDDLTGMENLLLLSKIKNKISFEDINKYIEIVKLSDHKDKKYKKYSMGMRQKLAIVQAIMEDQKIILLDEPFNGIDRESVIAIKNYLKSISKTRVIIITSHIPEDFDDLIDIYLKFDNGTISEDKKE